MVNGRLWRLCLAGAGNIGAGFLAMLRDRHDDLVARYGADLSVVGVAELGGAALDPDGLDLRMVVDALAARTPLAQLADVGRAGMTALDLLRGCDADLLLGATPVDLAGGQPGLDLARAALAAGIHVVLADKGPVALAYEELAAASDLSDGWGMPYPPRPGSERRPCLRFSATVAGALPVVNIGRRDLAGEEIIRIEGVFNGTSQYILRAIEAGAGFDEALVDTHRRGIAEADPSLDVDGYDAAFKLLVTANAVLGAAARLADVAVTGIRSVSPEEVRAAAGSGRRLVPLAVAERSGGGYRLRVGPEQVPGDHPLARLHPDEMGVVYYAGRAGRISAASLEPRPEPACAAMLRDVLDIIRTRPDPPSRREREQPCPV
jgi:homoserine dehydrogenase